MGTRASVERRAILELTREECLRLLAANTFGRVAVGGSGEVPIIRPVNYVYDAPSQSVAFRTNVGSKFYFLCRLAKAAFEIDGVEPDRRIGWSVIIAGVTQEVTNPSVQRRLDALELDTWAPGERNHWVAIRAWNVSGRQITMDRRSND